MQNSGTKLVVALTSLAFLLGATSWWYRYEAAHRASQFWGPEASRLIAEAENFQVWEPGGSPFSSLLLTVQSIDFNKVKDLSQARGQAHLRHALLSDRNYVWDKPLDFAITEWQWCLCFYEGGRQVQVLLSEDLKAIGKYDAGTDSVVGMSCEPMTASLEQYFGALGVLAKPQAEVASAFEE